MILDIGLWSATGSIFYYLLIILLIPFSIFAELLNSKNSLILIGDFLNLFDTLFLSIFKSLDDFGWDCKNLWLWVLLNKTILEVSLMSQPILIPIFLVDFNVLFVSQEVVLFRDSFKPQSWFSCRDLNILQVRSGVILSPLKLLTIGLLVSLFLWLWVI